MNYLKALHLPNGKIAVFPLKTHAVYALLLLWSISGCSSIKPGVNSATSTARAERVQAQATEMASHIQSTVVVDSAHATATAQVRQAQLAAAKEWPIILSDTFDSNQNDWPTGSDTGEFASITWTNANGKYRWDATAKQGFIWWSYPAVSDVNDFYLSVDAQQISGPTTAQMGLLLRLFDNSNFYLFKIDNNQRYTFELSSGDGWTTLLDWTNSPALKPDEVNHLTVFAEGNYFAFFVNGSLVAELTDDHLAGGKGGVAIGLDNAGDQAVFEFDNFVLRAPPTLQETPTP